MEYKERILKTLKDFGELPTGRIAAIVGMNYWRAVNVLQEMWGDDQTIISDSRSGNTYWKLKVEVSMPKEAESPINQEREK